MAAESNILNNIFGFGEDEQALFTLPPIPQKTLTDVERLDWLRLSRSLNVGPITFTRLIAKFGSVQNSLEALSTLSSKGGRKKYKTFSLEDAEQEIEDISKIGARLIARCEPDYPQMLTEIEDAPPVITVLGNTSALQNKSFAIVGTRNASINGRKMAQNIAKHVGEEGYMIASGLARGIDTCVHEASLETGTIAVVAGGVDVVYPKENERLYHEIQENGVIVAESPFGTQPQARHFPKRNRIISGISLGTLVVEASLKSGSLITARMTLEQNRELFAVPGSPMDPRSKGANKLLKDGSAHLVTHAEDILDVLNTLRLTPLAEPASDFDMSGYETSLQDASEDDTDALRENICTLLDTTPVHVDELIRMSNASVADVLSVLLELELAGRLERHPGNKVNLIEDDSLSDETWD